MHGNTTTTASGRKTRTVDAILDELAGAFDAHEAAGSTLAGVHFELTGEDVTECIGGPQELAEADLERSYQTAVDPRLNYAQSLELAFRIALRLRRRKGA
jgi:3-deoxy-7-phosphoheptulonate synthase